DVAIAASRYQASMISSLLPRLEAKERIRVLKRIPLSVHERVDLVQAAAPQFEQHQLIDIMENWPWPDWSFARLLVAVAQYLTPSNRIAAIKRVVGRQSWDYDATAAVLAQVSDVEFPDLLSAC